MNQEHLQTDILIIGGGVAGLNAALTAREAGLDVLIMDKAVIERSGHAAGGIDHFAAYLETGPGWDTQAAYLDFTGRSARGVTDLSVVEKVYCDELKAAIQRFEDIGCTLRQSDGSYYRTQSFGQPGPWWINFNGKRMKPLLGKAVRKAGCSIESLQRTSWCMTESHVGRQAFTSGKEPFTLSNPKPSFLPQAVRTGFTRTQPG